MLELTLFIGLLIFAFAIYGFVAFISRFKSQEIESSQSKRKNIADDVLAAAHLLNHLYQQNEIGAQQYRRLRDFLDKRFGDRVLLPQRLVEPSELTFIDEPLGEQASTAADVGPVATEARTPVVEGAVTEEIVDAVLGELVRDELPPIQPRPVAVPRVTQATPQVTESKLVALKPVANAESQLAAGRRTVTEILASFMQEKNIRWGELASGILIVGSAIGLVVSLRNELNETIPYFPALLFMLITAAIHAAGSYTLKKWKLSNTSRGTLLIGLLLVPLNFLSACILTDNEQLRRPLHDPIFWLAVTTGVVSFSFMTWWSSRLLLRRGNLPLVIGLMGAAILTLVINRFEFPGLSSWSGLTLALFVAGFAVTGSTVLTRSFWKPRTLSSRTVNRRFILLGLSLFAFAAAVSLILVRASDKPHALVSITPAITVVLMLAAACGGSIHARARGSEAKTQKIVGQSLLILGLILTAGSMVVSTSNPSILLINGFVATALIWVIAQVLRLPALIPAAWAALSVSVLSAVSLVAGNFEFDSWAGLDQLTRALVSGQSGLSLLALGTAITGLNLIVKRPRADSVSGLDALLDHRLNQISAGSIAGFGCCLALIAGLLHRSNVFETMTASALLLAASIVLLILTLRTRTDGLPVAASFTLLICLAFSFLWNPTVSSWIEPFSHGLNANWLYVFVGVALIIGIAAAISTRVVIENQVSSTTRQLGICAAIPAWISMVGGLQYAGSGTGLATTTIILALLAWCCISWSHRNDGGRSINFSISLALTTGLLPAVFLFEYASKLGLPPATEVSFWLIELIVLASWSTLWSLSGVIFGRFNSIGWIFGNQQIRADQVALAGTIVAILLTVGLRLAEATGRELDASFVSNLQPIGEILAQAWWSIVAAFVAVTVSLFYRVNLVKGVELVCLYILACCLFAAPFDGSLSVGSAIRWLVPIGIFVVAALSFLSVAIEQRWNRARQKFGLVDTAVGNDLFGGALSIDQRGKQLLINFLLAVSVLIVLAISSLVTAQILLTQGGAEALGGPIKNSWLGSLRAEVSYGGPGAVLTTAILLFAISQRRGWLAMAGSAVYQYVVVFSIIMLVLSVHPALATERFVETLLSVSLGMTGYGLIWYWQRQRIGGAATIAVTRKFKISQIELHTLINCTLVTSLAVLICGRFFFQPDQAGGWIITAGGPLGIAALVAVVILAYLVWRERVTADRNADLIGWLSCWTGLVLTAMVAAIADRASGGGQWIGFRVILWGSTIVSTGLTGIAWFCSRDSKTAISPYPGVAAALFALLFAMRGSWGDSTAFTQYILAIGLIALLTSTIGFVVRNAWPSLVSAMTVLLGAHSLTMIDPANVFSNGAIDLINLAVLGLVILSLAWTGFYIWRSARKEKLSFEFGLLPNIVLSGSSIWVLVGSLLECGVQTNSGIVDGDAVLAYPWGIAAVAAVAILFVVHLWNNCNRVQVASQCLWSIGTAILLVAVVAEEQTTRGVWIMFVVGLVAASWGIQWITRDRFFRIAEMLRIPRLALLRQSMQIQLPIFSLVVSSILLVAAGVSILGTEDRLLRLLTSITPMTLAVSIACLSDRDRRHWMQHLSLVLMTIGLIFVAWIDLVPSTTDDDALRFAIRTLIVLAGAIFVYGVLVSRWVHEGHGWLNTLREMTVANCAAALLCLVIVVVLEAVSFSEGSGSGVSVLESIAATIFVTGMIAGLIVIAVRPENDPFSLSLKARMGYVYAAEFVGMLLVCHLYFTMPWLFQFGLRQYWPYIAMALAFGGVGIAQVLEKRNLTVLGEPLFHTAAIVPVLVSALIWAVDSSADASLVLLIAGLAYLLISYTHQSVLSGAAAVVLGNLALWVFYNKFPNFSFFDHPQLWLIPPAVSVLIAGHLAANSLSRHQLAMLRYLCSAAIYISSTSEIFINGIGDQLWPPMVLALLSVFGIMAGIMLQVRGYLFLGALFLLMAMVTMVSHAHQRLDHIWPWWAFGIGLGVAILVMFGLFESRKSKMRVVAGKIQKWDL